MDPHSELVNELIGRLGLERHPEGGYFRQTYRSEMVVQSPVTGADRRAVTDIYYLLEKGGISRFHRVLHDEVWNFYEGGNLRLFDFDIRTGKVSEIVLGCLADGVTRKYVVPAGHWQAAEPLGDYALVGCTVAPGFEYQDYSFLAQPEKSALLAIRPDLSRLA